MALSSSKPGASVNRTSWLRPLIFRRPRRIHHEKSLMHAAVDGALSPECVCRNNGRNAAHGVYDHRNHARGLDGRVRSTGTRGVRRKRSSQNLHRRNRQQLLAARAHRELRAGRKRHHRGMQHRLWRAARLHGHALSAGRGSWLYGHRGRGYHGRERLHDAAGHRRHGALRKLRGGKPAKL